MAVVSAADLKARETPEFTLRLSDGLEVLVRRPDVQLLVLKGLISTPMLGEVVKLYAAWQSKTSSEIADELGEKNLLVLDFMDRFVCAVMVSPKVVLTEAELGPNALLASDLTVETKRAILDGVMARDTSTTKVAAEEVRADATMFPQDGPREGTGSDVSTLQAAAV